MQSVVALVCKYAQFFANFSAFDMEIAFRSLYIVLIVLIEYIIQSC